MDATKPKISYWIIAALGLVWNLMGAMNYIMQTNPDTVAQMPEAYQTLITTRPAWATAAFAIAVFGGAVGCILLLLRRRVAVPVLIASLIGVAGAMIHAVLSAGLSSQVMLGTGSSLLVALALLWMARLAAANGWLR